MDCWDGLYCSSFLARAHGEAEVVADAILLRQERGDQGTFGRLIARGLGLFSGELPWRENASSISCVPAGTYRAMVTYSPRFGRGLYLVDAVPARSGIRVHPANLMGDRSKGFACQLNGCIALGERLGWIDRQKAVLLSQPAVRRLEEYFRRRPFILEIRDPQ